jgi:bacteriocin-like protein
MKLDIFQVEQLSTSELQNVIGGWKQLQEPPVSNSRRRSHITLNDADHPEDNA